MHFAFEYTPELAFNLELGASAALSSISHLHRFSESLCDWLNEGERAITIALPPSPVD